MPSIWISLQKAKFMHDALKAEASSKAVPAPKKEPLATKLTGYMPMAKMCKNCRFITSDLTQCTNKKVQQDSQITSGANGLKDIIQTGWCNEWEQK